MNSPNKERSVAAHDDPSGRGLVIHRVCVAQGVVAREIRVHELPLSVIFGNARLDVVLEPVLRKETSHTVMHGSHRKLRLFLISNTYPDGVFKAMMQTGMSSILLDDQLLEM